MMHSNFQLELMVKDIVRYLSLSHISEEFYAWCHPLNATSVHARATQQT